VLLIYFLDILLEGLFYLQNKFLVANADVGVYQKGITKVTLSRIVMRKVARNVKFADERRASCRRGHGARGSRISWAAAAAILIPRPV
jgi:hypothetical protein